MTINLQRFSETPPTLSEAMDSLFASKMEAPAATEPTAQEMTIDTPAQTEAPVIPEQTTAPVPEPTQEPAPIVTEQPERNLFAGKYKTPEALEEGYRNVNTLAARTLNENKALKEKLERLEKETSAPKPPAPFELEIPDDINDRLFNDPKGTLKDLLGKTAMAAREAAKAEMLAEVDGRVAERIAPMTERQDRQVLAEQWSQAMTEYEAAHPDYTEFWPEMETFIRERGLQKSEDKIAAMEDAYLIAKGKRAMQTPPPAPAPTMEQMLADEGFIAKIMENEAIRNRIQTDLVARTRNTQNTLPRHIPQGGVSTAVPPSAPTSMQDAHRFLSEKLSRGIT